MSDNTIQHTNPFIFQGATIALLLGAVVHSLENTPKTLTAENGEDTRNPRFTELTTLFRSVQGAKSSSGTFYVRVPRDANEVIEVLRFYNEDCKKTLSEPVNIGVSLIATDMDTYPAMSPREVDRLIASIEAMLPEEAAA